VAESAPPSSSAPPVSVNPVESAAEARAFLRFPYRLYGGHPYWVPPLRADARFALDTERNPFYERAELARFLAHRDGRLVGRVAAIRNCAHNEFHGDRTGFFGFFEVEEDAAAAKALLAAVDSWHRERGMDRVNGPVNPSLGSECGLLVRGFEAPPVLMMPYNPPYYVELLERAGFRKQMDLYAFEVRRERTARVTERLGRLRDRLARRFPELRIRPLERANLRRDAGILRDVFDDARRDNYGFVPSTDAEFEALVAKLERIVDPSLISILEREGTPVGCVVGLPDWNVALHRSRRWPEPLRLFKILWERRHIRSIRVLAIAVTEPYRRSGILGFLLERVLASALEAGYDRAELSWVAEDNRVQLDTLRNVFDPEPYKLYRIYTRAIGGRSDAGLTPGRRDDRRAGSARSDS